MKPNVDIWAARMAQVAAHQAVWRSEAKVGEDLYELRWLMDGIPDGVPITMPSTARAIIDEATDHSDFDPRWLRIHTPTFGMTTKAEQSASRIRAFLPGWASYQISHLNDVSPFRDFIKNLNIYGKAVYKVVLDRSVWPDQEIPDNTTVAAARKINSLLDKEREFAMPVVLRSINPLAMYEDPSIGEKKWAIEVYEYDAVAVLPLYGNYLPPDRTREELMEAGHKLRVWDCYELDTVDGERGVWHQVFIDCGAGDTQIIAPADPTDDAVFLHEPFPYVIKFSGYGRQSGAYEEKARGILHGAKELLKAEGRRLTQLDAIIGALAWPTLFVNGPKNRFKVQYGPNVVNYIPPGVDVQTVTPTIPAGPIQSSLATLQAGIERATFGSVIRGDKPPQTTSAAQLAILSGQARLRFGSIKIHHEATMWEVFAKVLDIVKRSLDHSVTIWQVNDTDAESPEKLVITPADIPDRFSAHIEIINDPDEERDRRAQLGLFLYKEGIIDWEEAAERAGVEDTAAMRRRIIRDRVLFNSPAVMQALGEQFLLESGYDIESLTLEKAMRDLLILRQQTEMQNAIMQPPPQQAAGPATGGLSPQQLGGRPPSPTPNQAQANGMASSGLGL